MLRKLSLFVHGAKVNMETVRLPIRNQSAPSSLNASNGGPRAHSMGLPSRMQPKPLALSETQHLTDLMDALAVC